MKHRHLRFGSDFQVVINDKHSQAAQMTLAVGDREGGPKNRHVGADQWLFVVAGVGLAIVNRKRIRIRKGTLLLILRGEFHEIRNTGTTPLKTLNLYVPPGYTKAGSELKAGKAKLKN
jgi:mannose-6-phosphate isomerase-like protein (cupin superfamily)